MKKFLRELRLFWSFLFKSGKYAKFMSDNIYRIYLGHNKIIDFRDGFPVYSLSTPALFSKPAANFFGRALFKIIQNRNTPNLMSFAVTSKCNAACSHCSFFDDSKMKKRRDLSTKECRSVIKEAQEMGVSVINFVGGEPLIRNDFLKILKSVDKDLSTAILFTNGTRLKEKAFSLKKAGLDGVYVSLDSIHAKKHDKIRNKKGVFKKALAGIREAKKAGLSVGISCCISKEGFSNGDFDKIVEFGKKIDVHEVLFFDVVPTGRMKHCWEIMDDLDWIEEMIKASEKYNKDYGYPGVLVYSYSTSHRSTGCAGGVSYFYVSPFGDISPCDFNHKKMGNIRGEPLYQIWDKMSEIDIYQKAAWGGCKLKRSKYKDHKYISRDSF
ncbi:MAG: radical SAM protein [Candidatus Moranbacteria bacterium]|nr:radical SAM protein [Candidatus Moranbacteria bacterium]